MAEETALLIIDAQNDFCDPEGALYVPGAENDMARLADFIRSNAHQLEEIYFTLDSHVPNAIFHPNWFRNAENNTPEPFTQIQAEDVEKGTWKPVFAEEHTLGYLRQLEQDGGITHTIWPQHCLIGTPGHNVYPPLYTALEEWTKATQRRLKPVPKGLNPYTEHYGIFAAEVQLQGHPETQVNETLLKELAAFDQIILAGEAKSHCVGASVRQVLEFAPELAKKLTLLSDCTSPVTGFEDIATPTYDQARQKGMRTAKSEALSLA